MSTIRPDTNITRTADLESLDSRASLDALRQRDDGLGAADGGMELRALDSGFDQAPVVDSGESVLNASAWDGVADGQRLLSGDLGFEARLGGMELSMAADGGADAVLDAVS